ncbi:Lar family restriction alleviation protein [Bifidobacterium longum]|uniref:Lar family restriction alleviation protein n=1 Tax=Bifidobacterium longum TaxID=216816 RepID=UPI001E5C5017|nr:Lar family restriction alleviation protein [Bifidobacterium longum]
METTGIWDSRNNRHATVEHETLKPCPFCAGTPRIDDDVNDTTERYTVRCDCGGNMPGRYVPIDPSFQSVLSNGFLGLSLFGVGGSVRW